MFFPWFRPFFCFSFNEKQIVLFFHIHKFRSTGWFSYTTATRRRAKKKPNWNFCENKFNIDWFECSVFWCACDERLVLFLFPRNETPIAAPAPFCYCIMRIEKDESRGDGTFRCQSLCRKVLISITLLYWLLLQYHKCELSDCFIIHRSCTAKKKR